MSCFVEIRKVFRRFVANEQGNAGLEFVTSIPLLLGVMVFTAEYGQALRERMVLDNATQDVARFLARSAIDNVAAQPGPIEPAFYSQTIDRAEAFMEARVINDVTFSAQILPLDQTGNFRTDYYLIAVEAQTTARLPLLSLINLFSDNTTDGLDPEDSPNPLSLTMTAESQVRWLGGALPGSADCVIADQLQGLCP